MSEPLYGIVGIDQSETTRGNKGFETRSRKGEKRGGIRRRRTFGSNKFDPSGKISFHMSVSIRLEIHKNIIFYVIYAVFNEALELYMETLYRVVTFAL